MFAGWLETTLRQGDAGNRSHPPSLVADFLPADNPVCPSVRLSLHYCPVKVDE